MGLKRYQDVQVSPSWAANEWPAHPGHRPRAAAISVTTRTAPSRSQHHSFTHVLDAARNVGGNDARQQVPFEGQDATAAGIAS
jgi:hypothetical protein